MTFGDVTDGGHRSALRGIPTNTRGKNFGFTMVLSGNEAKLAYAGDYSDKSPIMMELDDELLESFNKGNMLVKFDGNGIGYLNAGFSTYQMRRIDNSNTQLVLSHIQDGYDLVESSCSGIVHLEKLCCSEIPDIEFRAIFGRHEDDIFPHLSYSTIWSDFQIESHLRGMDNYYLADGLWKRIDDETFYGDLDSLLNLCAIVGGGRDFNTEELWLQINELCESEGLPTLSLTYVQYLISRLCEGDSFENKGERQWPLVITVSENKLIVHRGRQLLFNRMGSSGDRACDLQSFIADWKAQLDTTAGVESYMWDEEGLSSQFLSKVIEGRAVSDQGMLLWLDSRTLSVNVEQRLVQLFKIKHTWNKGELESYISPLLAPGTKPEVVLLKTCRLDEEADGQLYYSPKF